MQEFVQPHNNALGQIGRGAPAAPVAISVAPPAVGAAGGLPASVADAITSLTADGGTAVLDLTAFRALESLTIVLARRAPLIAGLSSLNAIDLSDGAITSAAEIDAFINSLYDSNPPPVGSMDLSGGTNAAPTSASAAAKAALIASGWTWLDNTVTAKVKIYTGGSNTPNLEAIAVTYSGEGELSLQGKDIYTTHPENLTSFTALGQPLDGQADFTACTNLGSLTIAASSEIVHTPDVSGLAKLAYFNCGDTNITALPDVSATKLLTLYSVGNSSATRAITSLPNITGWSAIAYIDCTRLTISDPAKIDAILNTLAGQSHVSEGLIALIGPSMAARTSASDAAKAALLEDNWTIYVNELT